MPEPNRRRLAVFWPVLAAVALWLLWVGARPRLPVVPVAEARPAGELRMVDAEGRGLSLAGLEGSIVLLNLWADWCGPCRREAPRLSRIARELGPAGVVVVGLNADGLAPADLLRVGEAWEVGYTLASATRPLAGSAFEGQGVVPHNWLVDRRGRLRASRAGALSERVLRRALEQLLGESPASDAGPGVDAGSASHDDLAPQ